MRKVAIVTDSTAYIPNDLRKHYAVTVVPQVLIWGEKTYEDGVDIQPNAFYQQLATTKVMPTTSQVSVPNMKNAFSVLLEQGYDVLGIFISSKLSGTVQSAIQGRELLEKDKDHVEIVDSQTTAMAMGFQALTVARAAAQGASLAECKALAEKARAHTGVYFVVDTLEFLHRGGRIGGAQRLLGTALNLKPILTVAEGKVEAVERVRTKTKAVERLIEIITEKTAGQSPIRIASLHANAEPEAREMLAKLQQRLQPIETIPSTVSPVIGTHIGPGTVGAAYIAGL